MTKGKLAYRSFGFSIVSTFVFVAIFGVMLATDIAIKDQLFEYSISDREYGIKTL